MEKDSLFFVYVVALLLSRLVPVLETKREQSYA